MFSSHCQTGGRGRTRVDRRRCDTGGGRPGRDGVRSQRLEEGAPVPQSAEQDRLWPYVHGAARWRWACGVAGHRAGRWRYLPRQVWYDEQFYSPPDYGSVVVKELWLSDKYKDKDLRSEDKDKDLVLENPRGQGLYLKTTTLDYD